MTRQELELVREALTQASPISLPATIGMALPAILAVWAGLRGLQGEASWDDYGCIAIGAIAAAFLTIGYITGRSTVQRAVEAVDHEIERDT